MKINKLMHLLEKRAKGFSYSEVQEEFSCLNENGLEKNLNKNTKENFAGFSSETKEEVAAAEKIFDAEMTDCKKAVIESPPKRKRGRPKKDAAADNKKCGLLQAKMVLVKRKVHTFFVPPDMTAIKMLIEFEGRPTETEDDVAELAIKRKALLEEIKKELLGEDYED